jgi:hypothetical protein
MAMAAEIRRHRIEMRLIAAALGLVFLVSAGLVVSHSKRSGQGGETSASVQQPLASAPMIGAQPTPAQVLTEPQPSPPQQQPPLSISTGPIRYPDSQPVTVQDGKLVEAQPPLPSTTRIDPKVSPPRQLPPSSPPPPVPADIPSGSDRYPGSEPIKVENVTLPEIGVPVTSDVYTTSDSLSAVVSYYKQRYPDAEVTEVNGQTVIAVTRPGAIKVIAVGTTGSDTRIAIVRPK